jgi:hypothetical protein
MKPIEQYSENGNPGFRSTDSSPFIRSIQNGELVIKGKHAPDDIHQYLECIREWVDEYIKHPMPSTTLTINLEYLNGITSHYLYGIIRRLYHACSNVLVIWEYKAGDEYSLEQGQILDSLCKAKFKFIKIHSN